MNTLAMVQAVEAWAIATIPALTSYDYPPEELSTALPLVMCEVQADSTQDGDPKVPGMGEYQQTFLRAWEVDLIILASPDPAWTASHALYGYVDDLADALRRGVRLADSVVLSQYYEASYNPPEVEFADGTQARQVTVTVTVGEVIGAA